jgi:hypothetical protein
MPCRVLITASVCLLVMASYTLAWQLGPKPFLTVYDANGKPVGVVQSISSEGWGETAIIAFQADKHTFRLNATSEDLHGTTTAAFFAEPDCSGQPLILARGTLMPETLVLGPERTLYLHDPSLPSETVAIKSVRSAPEGPCEVASPGGEMPVHRTAPSVVLYEVFTPPFSIR